VRLFEVAAMARGKGSPLDTYYAWTREWMTFPNGAHVAEVEIDRDTGRVTLARYTAIDDYGVLVNPMIASGQAHGAIAQGVGQALIEHAAYDPHGQLVAGSLMDYALPRADNLPLFQTEISEVPSTTNPLGMRGGSEGGITPGLAVVANAIVDALREFGIEHIELPNYRPLRSAFGTQSRSRAATNNRAQLGRWAKFGFERRRSRRSGPIVFLKTYSGERSRIVFSVTAPFNPAAATCPPSAIRLRCASSQ
jgi:hypothetical protein